MLFRSEASVCMSGQYFFGLLGLLFKKSHIRRYDSTISVIANLEMLLHFNFFYYSDFWVTLEQF